MVTELPHLWAMSSATVVPLAVLIATAARRDRENPPSWPAVRAWCAS
ncbi:hypothetical protein [Streptomyces sp. KL116D]